VPIRAFSAPIARLDPVPASATRAVSAVTSKAGPLISTSSAGVPGGLPASALASRRLIPSSAPDTGTPIA